MEGVIRRLRLASGLVMFAYVTTHFVNHSLGLVSVQVMDRVLHGIYQYWSSPLGGFILYGAFAIHYSLALWALWLRRSLKMPSAEATQLVLGFSIPFFLVDHVLQTRVADTFYGANYGYYSTVLYAYFVVNPLRGALQFAVLLIAWIHAIIGLRFWLGVKPWYERWQPILYAFALLLPTLAILGGVGGGREVLAGPEEPAGSPSSPAPIGGRRRRMLRSSIAWWCGCVGASWRRSLPCSRRGSCVGPGSAGAASSA